MKNGREGKVNRGKVFVQWKSGMINGSWEVGWKNQFAEEENEFGFKDVCFAVLERHPDIRLEDYSESLSPWFKNWEQSTGK